jgi:hypothetical protein
MDTWMRLGEEFDAKERARKKRQTARLQKYRRWLYAIRRFMPNDCDQATSLDMIRQLLPEFCSAEARLEAAKAALDGQRTAWFRERAELQKKINALTCENTQLQNDNANAERERDDYMYQLDDLLNRLSAEPPEERQRSIVLEQT